MTACRLRLRGQAYMLPPPCPKTIENHTWTRPFEVVMELEVGFVSSWAVTCRLGRPFAAARVSIVLPADLRNGLLGRPLPSTVARRN